MKKVVTDNGATVIRDLEIASTFRQRFFGLMFRHFPETHSGLLIRKCKAIHCCFMLISIDVLFLSKDGEILYLKKGMRPWSFSPYIRGASSVLECETGTIEKYQLRSGQMLFISEA